MIIDISANSFLLMLIWGIFFIVCISVLFAIRPEIIEKNLNKIIVAFLILFLVEIGVGISRLPREFQNEIIPKLKQQLGDYSSLVDKIEEYENRFITLAVKQTENRRDILLLTTFLEDHKHKRREKRAYFIIIENKKFVEVFSIVDYLK